MLLRKLTMLNNKPKIDWMKMLRNEQNEPCPKCGIAGHVYMRSWEWNDRQRYAKGTYVCHCCYAEWSIDFNDY